MYKIFFYAVFNILLFINSAGAGDHFTRLDIVENDIENIIIQENSIWLKLNSKVGNTLKTITRKHVGEKLQIFLHEIKVIEMTISVSIESRIIYVANPSRELMEKAKTIQEVSIKERPKVIYQNSTLN
mgnify:CR=1 FL=1